MGKAVNKTFDTYASIVFILLGVAIYVYSQTCLSVANVGIAIGPKELPSFLAIALIVLGAINFYSTIKSKAAAKKGEPQEYKKFLIFVGSLILYALLIEPLGYVITTVAFLMVGFQTMEKGKYMTSALIAVIFAVGIYYLYVKVAMGTLPPIPILEI